MLDASLRIPKPVLQAYERHGRWLPGLATALLVVVLARVLADLVWLLMPVPEAAAWRPAPAPAVQSSAQRTSGPDAAAIADAHLFGSYQAPASPALNAMAEAPDTRLALTLLGILAATADKESRALISSSDGKEEPYSIGDDVTKGATLQAIFPDRVILSRNGQLETLRLDKASASPLAASYVHPSSEAAGEGETLSADTSEMLSQIRQQVLQDPSKASQFIRIQPANSGGQMRGYRIYPGRDRSIFSSAGLRPGDLVTSINGIQLDDPTKGLQMLGDLSQASSLSLTIERGGQQQTVNVNLN